MAKDFDDTSTHPVLRFLEDLEAGLDQIAEAPMWSLDAAATTEVITRIEADLARLAELETRTLTQAETLDLPDAAGTRSLAAWLSMRTRLTHTEAARKTRLTKVLRGHDLAREALAAGDLHAEQASVIAAAVDELDGEHTHHRAAAEAHLIDQAQHFDAKQLQRLGRRILETIDPDKADEHEAKLIEAQEARAAKKTAFRLWDDGQGLSHGAFTIPTVQAEMLRKALQALASPKHVRGVEGAGAYDHERPTPQRMGKAFVEYIERYPVDKLPTHGGLAATIVITVAAEDLEDAYQGGGKAAATDTGVPISPGQLIRLACEANLVPAVLDQGGHVLDLGRDARFHTKAQRLALLIEQQTCQATGCDTPGSFCHVHHTTPWSHGGGTNTRDAVLLCPFHHHQAHATGATYPIRT